ncbi:MAG TPA: universal stress protein [Crocinitomicaceae bacterium]|nr:universal stress protein [Crocinitomicaceae bacterium]
MNKKNFIVPYDFTSVADVALNHAIVTAQLADANIYLLHVVGSEKEIATKKDKLNEVISALKTAVEITPIIRIGNIFEDIGNVASEHNAQLIFMGTHGAHGWQHITGSHALRVITNSSVPFVVVQNKNIKPEGYKNIVVPLDLSKETQQKLVHVASLAKYFNSKIHIVTIEESDPLQSKKLHDNLLIAGNFLSEREIEYTTQVISQSGYDKEIVKHAVRLDADLIAIMNLNQQNLFGLLTANYEQYIITNDAEIPTLIVNPIEAKYGRSVLFS